MGDAEKHQLKLKPLHFSEAVFLALNRTLQTIISSYWADSDSTNLPLVNPIFIQYIINIRRSICAADEMGGTVFFLY